MPYWRFYVSYGSSGLARDLRSKAKAGHKHTLGALRAPNVCLCPSCDLDRKSQTSPDDPYDTYKGQIMNSELPRNGLKIGLRG